MALNSLTGYVTEAVSGNYPAWIIFLWILFIVMLICIALYIYTSLAFMKIARRAKVANPGLAWIPCVGQTIIAYKSSKMDPSPWWGLLIGFLTMIIGIIFLAANPLSVALKIVGILILIVAGYCLIYFSVYTYIWNWKLFEAVKRPGWWGIIPVFGLPFVLLGLIPLIGIIFSMISFGITVWYLAVMGITAWEELPAKAITSKKTGVRRANTGNRRK